MLFLYGRICCSRRMRPGQSINRDTSIMRDRLRVLRLNLILGVFFFFKKELLEEMLQ